MSQQVKQYSRFLHHRITTAGGRFTIPSSNDHTDDTWSSTDLYIGEIGVNVTDDTVWMRTNNGIIQIGASGSVVGGSGSSSTIVFNSNQLQIASTYSAVAFVPNVSAYTDLGSSALPWQDLYIGGTATGLARVNVNNGVNITQASNVGILTSGYDAYNNAPIQINATSSGLNHDRPLHLNSYYVTIDGTGYERASIGSKNSTIQGTSSQVALIGANAVTLYTGLTSSVHIGYGYGKTNYTTNTVTLGGKTAIRGVHDDGSTQYNKSDWVTTQAILRTTNALTYNIASIPWGATGIGGVMQVKAYVIATNMTDSTLCYSAEGMACYIMGTAGTTASLIGAPIVNEVSSFPSSQPTVDFGGDADNVYIKVAGIGTDTIQWLVTYHYQMLMNIS